MPNHLKKSKEYEQALLDLNKQEERKTALAKIAIMCMEGYSVETVGPKTEKVITLKQKNPQAAIRAILALEKMVPTDNVVFEVNIFEDCHQYDDDAEELDK